MILEKNWKEKISQTKKELGSLKKELTRIERNTKYSIKQKNAQTGQLQRQLEEEIKLAQQPLRDLEMDRDSKIQKIKREAQRLSELEKPVTKDLHEAIKLLENINAKFEILGIKDSAFKNQMLIYVPFYTVCYQSGINRRFIFQAPSVINSIGFGSKLKGALGMSKLSDLFVYRFRTITNLLEKQFALAKGDPSFESEIVELGEKNNLLKLSSNRRNISDGLNILIEKRWLSEKEYKTLIESLQ